MGNGNRISGPSAGGLRADTRHIAVRELFQKTFTGLSLSLGLTWQLTEKISIKVNKKREYLHQGVNGAYLPSCLR
jgi:hypothetical protein